ncbi:unnamed protein product [Camellia sinensis]
MSRERVFYPIVYGADPTGAQDSSDAIQSVLEDALQVQNGIELLPGIKDLGGVVIDLQGGNYLISKPIRFPSGIGNFLVQGGSFRASDTFPSDRHLIELWAPNSQPLTNSEGYFDQKSPIYYEDIAFRDILFDSSYRGGGIFVIDSARIRIHDCFFIHFTSEGILVQKGHETFISTSFLGQRSTVGGDKGERDFSGTAIDLASNDNAVTDVVIFSAATGIILRGQANLLTGVHCYNKATVFGGVGILVKSAQNRIHNCYMDYNAIVIEDPFQVQVANGFFLEDGNCHDPNPPPWVKDVTGQQSSDYLRPQTKTDLTHQSKGGQKGSQLFKTLSIELCLHGTSKQTIRMYVNNSQQRHSDIGSIQTGSSKTKSTHKNYKQTYTKLRHPDKIIAEVKLVMDENVKRSKGYAFIQCTSQDDALLALESMDHKVIFVKLAKPGHNAFGVYSKTTGPPQEQNIANQDEAMEGARVSLFRFLFGLQSLQQS